MYLYFVVVFFIEFGMFVEFMIIEFGMTVEFIMTNLLLRVLLLVVLLGGAAGDSDPLNLIFVH